MSRLMNFNTLAVVLFGGMTVGITAFGLITDSMDSKREAQQRRLNDIQKTLCYQIGRFQGSVEMTEALSGGEYVRPRSTTDFLRSEPAKKCRGEVR